MDALTTAKQCHSKGKPSNHTKREARGGSDSLVAFEGLEMGFLRSGGCRSCTGHHCVLKTTEQVDDVAAGLE